MENERINTKNSVNKYSSNVKNGYKISVKLFSLNAGTKVISEINTYSSEKQRIYKPPNPIGKINNDYYK